ncbi:MAG: alcohol dehydrogenase catalytic domain-containing protein, partial [Chloroflexi bacterium]|nr:alcohol dehydrogenase catalytic domain-containing protein [Chloroflexota bacterium]
AGQPLRYERIRLPSSLRPGEALLAVDLATICGSDLHTTGGRRRQPTPAVLGHEGSCRVPAASR